MDSETFEIINDTLTKNNAYKNVNTNSTQIIDNKETIEKKTNKSDNESNDSDNESNESNDSNESNKSNDSNEGNDSSDSESNESNYIDSETEENIDSYFNDVMWVIMLGDKPYYVSDNDSECRKYLLNITLDLVDYFRSNFKDDTVRINKERNGYTITKRYNYFLISYEEEIVKLRLEKVKCNLKKVEQ